MRKRIINILLSFLLTITIFVTIFTLTILNDNFIKMNLKKYDYYDVVYENIKRDLLEYNNNLDYSLDKNKMIKDINTYVKSRYDNKYYISKIETDVEDSEIRDIYNKNIKFNNIFKDYNMVMIIYGIYLFDIILIIITGTVFVKTKKNHDIYLILVVSSVISFFVYGVIYITNNINIDILSHIVNSFAHYYLAINIILFEYSLFKKIKK